MKKLVITSFVSMAIAAALAYASNGPQPALGLYWYDNTDPAAGAGMSAPLNQLLVRTDTSQIYYKSGTANTAWTALSTGGGGGTVTSVACGVGLSCSPSPITTTGTATLAITPTTCGGGMAEISTAADGTSSCATFSTLTNGAGANVIPKSNGTNLVTSAETDDGTTFAVNSSKFTVTEASGNTSVAGTFASASQIVFSGVIAPTAFSGTRVDNYNPAGLATAFVISQDSSSATTITGITAQPTGTILDFHNISTTSAITLSNADTNSSVGNRFSLPGGVSWILPIGASMTLRYNGTVWRPLSAVTTDFPSLVVDGTSNLSGGATTVGSFIQTIQVFSTTGSQNNLALNANTTILQYTGGATGTWTGITGGVSGRRLRILNTSGNTLNLTRLSGSSTAANQLNTFGAQSEIVVGNTSAVDFVYDGVTSLWDEIGRASTTSNATMTFASSTTTTSISASGNLSTTTNLVGNGTGTHIRSIVGSNDSVTLCGSSPSPTIVATDTAGRITIGGSGATGCTITFTNTYTSAPSCTVQFETAGTSFSFTPAATTLTISSGGSLAGLIFDYHCIGEQ